MAKQTILILDASKNSQGDYECHTVTELQSTKDDSSFKQFSSSGDSHQRYYIDPDIVNETIPSWSMQANNLFFQTILSNYQKYNYTEYMIQVREQFEKMRQSLQEQMAKYN